MVTLTIENYVKTIYQICLECDGRPAATGHLAAALSVSPGTVTSMLKTLDDSGLAEYRPYEGVRLTASGKTLALRVLRRHRLIELFLVQTLGLSWDEVHDEAENMEHAISDFLVDRVDQFLGFPSSDPHGDPIPRADGTVDSVTRQSLVQWQVGQPFQLVRVLDQSPAFLRYLSDSGLQLGATGELVSTRPEANVLTVIIGSGETTLSCDAASKLLVADVPPTENEQQASAE